MGLMVEQLAASPEAGLDGPRSSLQRIEEEMHRQREALEKLSQSVLQSQQASSQVSGNSKPPKSDPSGSSHLSGTANGSANLPDTALESRLMVITHRGNAGPPISEGDLEDMGHCPITWGNKHKGESYSRVYETDPDYVDWLRARKWDVNSDQTRFLRYCVHRGIREGSRSMMM